GYRGGRLRHEAADTDREVTAVFDGVLHVRFVVRALFGLFVADLDAGFFFRGRVHAFPRRGVERGVFNTANVGHHARLELGGRNLAVSWSLTTSRGNQRETTNNSDSG